MLIGSKACWASTSLPFNVVINPFKEVPSEYFHSAPPSYIALFLTSLAKKGLKTSELRDSFPKYVISKNKIELTPQINVDQILEKVSENYKNFEVDKTDGVKIYIENEWVHLRKSNTEPIIRIYSESTTEEKANLFAEKFISEIKELC